MASKVNTKFVVLLVAGLAAVCIGLVGLAYFQHMRSSGRLIAQGDKFFAEGQYKLAADKYSRAVYKEQGSVEFLEKWRDALIKTTPPTQAEYNEAYARHYTNILNKIAVLRPTDPERQLPLIEELDRRAALSPGGGSVQAIQSLVQTIDERLERLDPQDPITRRILGLRGIAGLQEMARFPVDQAKRDRVLADLRAGAAVATDSPRFQIAIVDWHESEIARLAQRENRPAEAEPLREQLAIERAALVEKFGDRPEVVVHEFMSETRALLATARTPEAYRTVLRGRVEPATQLLATLEAVPLESLSVDAFLEGIGAVDSFADRSQAPALAAWAERVLESRPEDPRTIIATARLQRAARNYQRSFELFDRAVALKDVPVSLEGIVLPTFRRMAAGERVDTALLQREEAEDPAERARFLEVAKAQREELKKLVDVGQEWELDLRDARIAMVEQDYRKAIALFEKLRSQGQSDNRDILLPLGEALARSGSEGMARTIYERVLATNPQELQALVRLADIEIGLSNIPKAVELLERAQQIEPNSEFINTRLANLRAYASGETPAAAEAETSPLVTLVIRARRAREEGNLGLARQLLREALDLAPTDARLVREAVSVEMAASDRPAALKLVEEALAGAPDNVELRSLKTRVEIEDPVEAAKQIIADSNDAPVVKALSMYVVYAQNNRTEEADRAFAEAEKLDPNYPAVVEIGFNRALRTGESDGFAKATEIAERAARLDVDQRGGLTFQGRLELAKGNRVAAEQTLQRAVERMEFDPNAWRWLGMAQQFNGKIEQALASYERAYKGNEKDASIAAEYASLLVGTGQGARALAVLSPETGVLRFDDRNQQLVNAWLDLEAQFGDRSKAVDARKKFFESKPGDASNSRQYLGLLVQDQRFDDADAVINGMEATGAFTPLDIASGRARVMAARGEVEAARAMLVEHVNAVPKAERTEDMYLLLGAFEREHGTPDSALLAFEAGREFQNPVVRGLDRASGDLHFSLGDRASAQLAGARADAESGDEAAAQALAQLEAQARDHYTKAEEFYAAIAKADPAAVPVKKRHAETLIRLERFDEAFAVLKSIGDENDLQVLLLQETLASRKGDIRAARAALDRAVERHPNNPMPFFRRAVLNRADPTLRQDVMKDLDQAIRLNPGMIDAWQLRVAVLVDQGTGTEDDATVSERARDQAIAELGRAVEANPNNDELIRYYLRVLRSSGRRDQAKKIAYDVAMARGTDIDWLRRAAIWAYDLEDYQQAEALYKKIYDLEPGPGPAADLLNCYLRRENPPPTRAEVNRILPLLVKAESQLSPGEKMLIARAREFLEERAEAEKWTVSAYNSARENPFDSRLWFENVVLRFGKDREKAFEYVLNKKEYQPLPTVIRLLALRREVTNGRPLESALEALDAMAEECSTHPFSKMEMLRLRNMFNYSLGRYAESAEDCREGLKIMPRDLEFNNNLAYILAKHLDDPEGAVKPAELAAELAPSDPAVLDTLGWVYFRVGKFRDADRVFARSIQTAKTPDDFVPTYLHQAQSKNAIGDKTEATRFILLAKSNLEQASQTIKDVYTAEIEALLKELTGAE